MAGWQSDVMLLNETEGDRTALVDADSGRSLTYRALAAEVEKTRLTHNGIRPGWLLFLPIRPCFEDVLLYLAALDAGCTVALLDPQQYKSHRARLEAAYHPDLLVRPPTSHSPYLLESESPTDRRLWVRQETDDLNADTAVLLPTSGSTGSPKLVRLSSEALLANAHGIRECLAISDSDVAIANLPLHYSYGLSVLNSHLAAGATVVLTETSALQPEFWEIMAEHGVTTLAGVPYSYDMYRRVGLLTRPLPALCTLTQAGGRMAPERILEFQAGITARGGRMYVMYGQTEATARMSVLDPSDLPEYVGSVGTPLPDGKFEIRNAADDGTGEVIYCGPNVMLGYAETRDDLNKGDELCGVLETGDLGRLDLAGRLWIVGRTKRIAKLFGERVSLDDVEDLLVEEGPTAVVDASDQIILYCEWGAGERFSVVRRALARELGTNPKAFDFRRVDRIPRRLNGKVAYGELRDRL